MRFKPVYPHSFAISEVFAGLELVKNGSLYERQELYYWLRLSKGAIQIKRFHSCLGILPLQPAGEKHIIYLQGCFRFCCCFEQ